MNLIQLLTIAVNQRASDLHLSPNLTPTLRINGDLIAIKDMPILNGSHIKDFLYQVMDQNQQQQLTTLLELDFTAMIPNIGNFRVNAFHQIHGLAAVFRVIPSIIPTLEQLALPQIIKKLLEYTQGLILITGATGSGKSTTLAAMVNYLNTHYHRHIITIEDPVEFIHQSKQCIINQRQVYRDTAHFSAALRSALREDPDVILVGEMRDLETIRLALTAAETGHLVMATLHTSSAPRAISRVIDVFPAAEKNIIRNLLSESLQAVVCQSLLKAMSNSRVAAFEIMLATPAIRNLIREDKIAQLYTAMQTGGSIGMCTLEQSLADLVAKQVVSPAIATVIDSRR